MSERKESAPELMTVNDVAAQLRVSTKTARRLIAGGDLKVHRFGRLVRVSRDDFITYIKSMRA